MMLCLGRTSSSAEKNLLEMYGMIAAIVLSRFTAPVKHAVGTAVTVSPRVLSNRLLVVVFCITTQ
jgi:hypothetical protein